MELVFRETQRKGILKAEQSLCEMLEYGKEYSDDRGMSRWRDIIDWVGGYPYEVASPDEIFDFYKSKG